jgi:hypothetical protein
MTVGLKCELRPHLNFGSILTWAIVKIGAILNGWWDHPIRSRPVVGTEEPAEKALPRVDPAHLGFVAAFAIR